MLKIQKQGFVLILTVFAFIIWGCDTDNQASEDTTQGETENEMEHVEETSGDHDHDHEAETTMSSTEDLEVSGTVEDGVRVVEVIARQFEFEPNQIVVEEGEDVRLEMTSEEVEHGIMIEGLDIEEDLPPNETVEINFTAPEPESYHFHCSVYCGAGHDRMTGELVVLEAEE